MTAEGDSDLQVDGEALHRERRLKTEGVKLLGHREQALKHTKTRPDEAQKHFSISLTNRQFDNREFELMLCVLRLATKFLTKNHQEYHSYETLVLIFTAFLTSLPFVPLIYFFSFSCCKAKKSHSTDLDTLAAVDRNFQISPFEREVI